MYLAIATTEEGAASGNNNEDLQGPRSWFSRYIMGGKLSDANAGAILERKPEVVQKKVLRIHPGSIRQITYFFFWSLCILAKILTDALVPPEQIEHSDLIDVFGYNNICVYWDYTPSRELVALYYPLFEYSFLMFVLLDYFLVQLSFRGVSTNNSSANAALLVSKYTLPIKLVLTAWFRMIFVYQVDMEQPDYPEGYGPYIPGATGHTLGFFGMQIALLLVALENVLFITASGIAYPGLGVRGTKVASWAYFIIVTPLTLAKIYLASRALSGNPLGSNQSAALAIDKLWMLLIAVMPIWFAHVARKTKCHIKITLEKDSIAWHDSSEADNANTRYGSVADP